MHKFDFYFFWLKINLGNHANPIVVIIFTQNVLSYMNILNIDADVHFVFEEIKCTFKSIITWDTFQLDGRVGCWNVLVITLSSWYCFGYWISRFQFTASCIDFICCNKYKVYTRNCFFTEFEHLFCYEDMARCCFLQTSPCCHYFHGSSYPITRWFAMTCGKKIPLAIYREVTGMKTKVVKMFPVFILTSTAIWKVVNSFDVWNQSSLNEINCCLHNFVNKTNIMCKIIWQNTNRCLNEGILWSMIYNNRVKGTLALIPMIPLNSILDNKLIIFGKVTQHNSLIRADSFF